MLASPDLLHLLTSHFHNLCARTRGLPISAPSAASKSNPAPPRPRLLGTCFAPRATRATPMSSASARNTCAARLCVRGLPAIPRGFFHASPLRCPCAGRVVRPPCQSPTLPRVCIPHCPQRLFGVPPAYAPSPPNRHTSLILNCPSTLRSLHFWAAALACKQTLVQCGTTAEISEKPGTGIRSVAGNC